MTTFIVITPEWERCMRLVGIWDEWKDRVIVKEPHDYPARPPHYRSIERQRPQ